jgi:uncharacterized protein YhfF
LVLAGRKRATAPSLWSFALTGEDLPEVGQLDIVTDWRGCAQCVIRTTDVYQVPFRDVSAEHAALEGEGDGSLEYWRRVHREYYTRELAGSRFTFGEHMPVVCRTFTRVFPPPTVSAPEAL